jgi:hypothetical protein
MLARPLLRQILENDSLTRGLADPEARILIEWLVERAEHLAEDALPEPALALAVQALCLHGRAIARFVVLWCHAEEHAGAVQLAAAQRFTWPLPTTTDLDPCELMQFILACEEEQEESKTEAA